MVQFIIADTLRASKQIEVILNEILKNYQKKSYLIVLANQEYCQKIKDGLTSMWPKRAILVANKPSKGLVCVTSSICASDDPDHTCVINTVSDLMVPPKSCNVLVEIVIGQRESGREKYKFYTKLGIKPHVEQLN